MQAVIRVLMFISLFTAAQSGRLAVAGPKVTLGRQVAASQRVSIDRVEHSVWNDLLGKYVNASGQVNYALWKRSGADVAALDGYLARLSAADPKRAASREAKLAFWINAYNAVTIRGILREYPTSSIRNHTARIYGYNIWKDLLLVVGGESYSLEGIEHEVLRKMKEPRIHFAIVCASISCPRLRNEAYTSERLEEQLRDNAVAFFRSPSNFRHDVSQRRFQLSSILKWFATDFGATQADQLRSIGPYLPSPAARQAAAGNQVRISYLSYDWGLNDQATRAAGR